MPPTKSWKNFELRISKIFGGKRRGAYTSDGESGKTDVIVDGFAIECKLLKRPTFQQMFSACLQAERNAEKITDIPIAIVKKNHQSVKDKDALVIMRLETFRDFFVD